MKCYFFSPVWFYPCITTSPVSLPGRPSSILALGWGQALFLIFIYNKGKKMHSHPSGFLQIEWSPALGFIALYRNLTLERKTRAYVPRRKFPSISHL